MACRPGFVTARLCVIQSSRMSCPRVGGELRVSSYVEAVLLETSRRRPGVHRDDGACDAGGALAEQVDHGRGHLIGGREPP